MNDEYITPEDVMKEIAEHYSKLGDLLSQLDRMVPKKK